MLAKEPSKKTTKGPSITMLPINDRIYDKTRVVLTVQKVTLPVVWLPFRLYIADQCLKFYFNVDV